MVWHKVFTFINSIEHEYSYAGKNGAKGEKREKRRKATTEDVKRQNRTNRIIKYRRLIKANFMPGDLWCCVKYPKGVRKDVAKVKKDIKKFIDDMRKQYKKIGVPLKFIYRMEIGKNGGIHFHIIVNRLWGMKEYTDVIMSTCWGKVIKSESRGLVDFRPIYEAGGYESLAAYITKTPEYEADPQEQYYEQICFSVDERNSLASYSAEDQKKLLSISSSRNLIRPEPEKERVSSAKLRKILLDGPKAKEGYVIDQDSIQCGINPYNGMSFYKYSERRIDEIRPRGNPKEEGWE